MRQTSWGSHPASRFGASGGGVTIPMDSSLAAGADGLLIEVHPTPETALSDADQSLTFAEFGALMRHLTAVPAVPAGPGV